ncbi:MAG: DUF134 domain-containing protein [Fusobacteriota bacterium]
MPRRKKRRRCRKLKNKRLYKPTGIKISDIKINEINLDEFEAMRLCDLDGKSQIEAGEVMGISRGTIQRLLNSGREKVIKSFLNTEGILINKE